MIPSARDRRRLVEEFLANPIGHHSPDLQHILLLLRGEPANGKYALVCTEPYREWTLARLSGETGKRTTLLKDHVYTSIADAERAVFRLRWKKQFGDEI